MNKQVLVVIGAGGIGQAIARHQGAGRCILLADVSSRESVSALAQAAAEMGSVTQVVNTAGLSPVQASPQAILAVDLVGVALVLEEFGKVITPGGSGIVVSS